MRATFWAAYASRLHHLADRIEAAQTPEDIRTALTSNSDLWAALDADVRAGLTADHPVKTLGGILLTRARTVAEKTRAGGQSLPALCLLNRRTALALTGEDLHPPATENGGA